MTASPQDGAAWQTPGSTPHAPSMLEQILNPAPNSERSAGLTVPAEDIWKNHEEQPEEFTEVSLYSEKNFFANILTNHSLFVYWLGMIDIQKDDGPTAPTQPQPHDLATDTLVPDAHLDTMCTEIFMYAMATLNGHFDSRHGSLS